MNKRLMVGVLVFSLVLMLSVGGVSALSLPGWLEDVLGLDRVGLSPSDLELHLEFENDLTDSSGNGRDGSCSGTGCPGAGVGKIGNGGEFDLRNEWNAFDVVPEWNGRYRVYAEFDYGTGRVEESVEFDSVQG
tara:strand:- start:208 stop:606 length:399 start_codon:yes stop_codon:yes gene_type:complete